MFLEILKKIYFFRIFFCKIIFVIVFFIEGSAFLEASDTGSVFVSTLSVASSFLNRSGGKHPLSTKWEDIVVSEKRELPKKKKKISFKLLELYGNFMEVDKFNRLKELFEEKRNLSKGVSSDSKDIEGKILFEIALEWKNDHFILFLIRNGVVPDRDNADGKNLIFYVIKKCFEEQTEEWEEWFESFRCLMERGWDLNVIRESDQKMPSLFLVELIISYRSLPDQEILEKILKKFITYFVSMDSNYPKSSAGKYFLDSLLQVIKGVCYTPLKTDTMEFSECLVRVVKSFIEKKSSQCDYFGIAEKTDCLFFLTKPPPEELKNGRFPSSPKVEVFFSLIKFFINQGAEIKNDRMSHGRTILFDLIEGVDFFERARASESYPDADEFDLFHLIDFVIVRGASVNDVRESDGATPLLLFLEKIDIFNELCSNENYSAIENIQRFFDIIEKFIVKKANVNDVRSFDGSTPFLVYMEKMQKCSVLFHEWSKKMDSVSRESPSFSHDIKKFFFQIELFLKKGGMNLMEAIVSHNTRKREGIF